MFRKGFRKLNLGSHGRKIMSRASSPWIPTVIGGCILWLRSDLGVTKDGSDNVSSWVDQSDTGCIVAQATGSKQPLWTSTGIVFDGVDDYLTGAFAFAATNIHVLYVAKRISITGANRRAVTFIDGTAGDDYDQDTEFILDFDYGDGSRLVTYRAANKSLALHPGNDIVYLFETKFDNVNNTAYLNGAVQSPVLSTGAFSIDNLYLGCGFNSGAAAVFHNISISEIIVYNSDLSNDNQLLVEDYLNERYVIY